MLVTKLCDNCWELTSRSKGFVVLSRKSQNCRYFRDLEPALEFFATGPNLLLGVIKGKLK